VLHEVGVALENHVTDLVSCPPRDHQQTLHRLMHGSMVDHGVLLVPNINLGDRYVLLEELCSHVLDTLRMEGVPVQLLVQQLVVV